MIDADSQATTYYRTHNSEHSSRRQEAGIRKIWNLMFGGQTSFKIPTFVAEDVFALRFILHRTHVCKPFRTVSTWYDFVSLMSSRDEWCGRNGRGGPIGRADFVGGSPHSPILTQQSGFLFLSAVQSREDF